MFLNKLFRSRRQSSPEAVLIRRANAARDDKKYGTAALLYEEALAHDPSLPHVHVQCGHMHKETGDLETAERHYMAARATLPGDADLELQLGHLYKVWGRPQQAMSFYENAMSLEPSWTEPRQEAKALERAGVPPMGMFKNKGRDLSPMDCHLDEITSAGWLRGRAVDHDHKGELVLLHFVVDGAMIATVRCDEERLDVFKAGLGPLKSGFMVPLPPNVLDGEEHVLEIRDASERVIPFAWAGSRRLNCRFIGHYEVPVKSAMDAPSGATVKGWVLREDIATRTLHGGCDILVTCDDAPIGYLKADRYRGDVGKFHGEDNCGYHFTPATRFRKPYPQTFRLFLMPEKRELDGSPYTMSFLGDAQETRVIGLVAEIERIHLQLTRLRHQAREALPDPGFSLADYDRWARHYFAALRVRTEASRNPKDAGPLVSIIMPAYRPVLSDFTAAVESVLAQTYANWELIIVDDGSGRSNLTAQIDAFHQRDPRIRPVPLATNAGISAATNTALDAARGTWVAFFDHDDLLVDVALEVMVRAAAETGARMLYSDEDKVEPPGRFAEPAFKPDWNYRLLLGVNYVCHLLMVERKAVDAVGRLESRYDGAQDHDFILRLSEHIPPERIHHVPEVLYHWRKTRSSTALDSSTKSYAADAGIAAVSDHLKRIGRPAKVTSMLGTTYYDVAWTQDATPAVSIVIPFRDEVATTRTCVEHILQNTRYDNYEVVLVDNWSTKPETLAFLRDVTEMGPVRVLRVEEEFNYSRLNNIAAATCSGDFLMLMNNDLFVNDPAWLRTVVDEALSDPKVGVVGGKFYYPNGRIQHAGVVLGIGGVAGHVHTGKSKDDGGYGGRAFFAQEMSAVTAAGLLIRADVFNQVGGFDEQDLKVAFNDIDLCLKVRKAGYKVVWTPRFEAEHHESLSRGTDEVPEKEARFFHETQTMIGRWGPLLRRDPFYSPHFLLDRQPFFDLDDPEAPPGA